MFCYGLLGELGAHSLDDTYHNLNTQIRSDADDEIDRFGLGRTNGFERTLPNKFFFYAKQSSESKTPPCLGELLNRYR